MSGYPRRRLDAILFFAIAFASPAQAQLAISGPILPSERQTMEPPRTVPASEYRDGYCAKWTDGCSVCQRKAPGDEPACQPVSSGETACLKQPVQCQSVLKTIGRVCLLYTDGCNHCGNGYCTAMACRIRLPDGTSKQKEIDFHCTSPRHDRYDDPQLLELDLQGHWRLIDPHGNLCEIIIQRSVSLSAKCIELGPPVTDARQAKASGTTFQLLRSSGEPLLSFETSNLESLAGIEQSTGFRLVRLEPAPFDFARWEGAWTLEGGGMCDLFLSMRSHRIASKVEVKVPHEIGFASNCLDPDDDTSIRFRIERPAPTPQGLEGPRRTLFIIGHPVLVPRWKTWQVEGHDITFRDDSGGSTVFKPDLEGYWTTELPQAGYPPLVLRLKPQRR
jgi:hypothetical protein